MEQAAREQIRLVVDHLIQLGQDAVAERLKAIYHKNAASGCLQSGGTVRTALRTMEEIASQLIKDAVEQVGAIAKEAEAFVMLHASFDDHLNWLEQQSVGVAAMASGNPRVVARHDSVQQATKREFAAVRAKLTRQIEIHRFAFATPSQSPLRPDFAGAKQTSKGGRPPSEFWEEMWAWIAFSLYVGDLKPKNQAAIESAIGQWIEDRGYSAAQSTIKKRARPLWNLIQDAEE